MGVEKGKGTSLSRKKETAIRRTDDSGKITSYAGSKAKEDATKKPTTEAVNAAEVAAKKAAADAELKKNQEAAKKKKLSPLDIAMGRR